MKTILSFTVCVSVTFTLFSQQWSGNNNTTDPIWRSGLIAIESWGGAQIRLNSQGTYYGKIGNPSAQAWSLGWGGSGTDINQVLTWTATGSVGIGTSTPESKLDVRGAISTNISGNEIGGTISIKNPAKVTNGTASNWQIYNMSGPYGNSLQFWSYDNLGCVSGGLCASRLTLMDNGNVGIGTANPQGYKLAVAGKIISEEVVVKLIGNWPDYVFENDYKLPSLEELQLFIAEHKHLPGVPTAKEIEENGLAVGEMNAILLKKIEELTLHLIEATKDIQKLQNKVEEQAADLKQVRQSIK